MSGVDGAAIGLHEAFDQVHDGAVIIDPGKTALSLFVTTDGQVRIQSPYSTEHVVDMLAQLLDKMRARITPPANDQGGTS